jgi:hypothetical protein
MSTHWQDDQSQYRAHGDGETPVAEVNDPSAPDASAVDRAETRDEAHHLLREIAQGYCYIGIARWSRDPVAVRTNLRCALHVLRNIDAYMHHVQPADPAWRKVQTASDHLRNRLMEAFSNLLDQVVHELPRYGLVSKRARDDAKPGTQWNLTQREGACVDESGSSALSSAEEHPRDGLGGSSPGTGEPSSALAPAEDEEGSESQNARGT